MRYLLNVSLALFVLVSMACSDNETNANEVYTDSCKELVSVCGGSMIWPAYFSPFSENRCLEVFECTEQLYETDCVKKLQSMAECLGTITEKDCDTKCTDLMLEVQNSCPCPSSCGVSCGG